MEAEKVAQELFLIWLEGNSREYGDKDTFVVE